MRAERLIIIYLFMVCHILHFLVWRIIQNLLELTFYPPQIWRIIQNLSELTFVNSPIRGVGFTCEITWKQEISILPDGQ